MRDIKFRAWDTVMKKMIYSFLYLDWEGAPYFDKDPYGVEMSGTKKIFRTDRYVPLQFTGLKDSKGVDIYEGDILSDGEDVYKVVFWNGCAQIENVKDKAKEDIDCNADYLWNYTQASTVIGSIYENHELLNTIK